MDDLVVTPKVVLPARSLSWSASRSSGPGGQNVNKVASKVDLRFDIEASSLPADVRERLRLACQNRLDAEGHLVIVSSNSRDQSHNLREARAKLAALVLRALIPPTFRRPTKPTRASRERRLTDKKHSALKKQHRGVSPHD